MQVCHCRSGIPPNRVRTALRRTLRQGVVAVLLVLLAAPISRGAADDRAAEREAMVETIQRHARTAATVLEAEVIDPAVVQAMRSVPRHAFVPPDQQPYAHEDRPLPIGHGQTISQPFIVALMTDLLNVEADDRVLEVGTGSGYQAAILATLVDQVHTIEIIPELARTAGERLEQMFPNVVTRVGDGYYGWPEAAPFDSIVVTAAAGTVPPPLVQQLKPGGRMVIPVGSRFAVQHLMLVEKDRNGSVTTRQLLPVQFVPLLGQR
jgi:protein-L-isoaspartate(D-aspartate) O-methyltransferase